MLVMGTTVAALATVSTLLRGGDSTRSSRVPSMKALGIAGRRGVVGLAARSSTAGWVVCVVAVVLSVDVDEHNGAAGGNTSSRVLTICTPGPARYARGTSLGEEEGEASSRIVGSVDGMAAAVAVANVDPVAVAVAPAAAAAAPVARPKVLVKRAEEVPQNLENARVALWLLWRLWLRFGGRPEGIEGVSVIEGRERCGRGVTLPPLTVAAPATGADSDADTVCVCCSAKFLLRKCVESRP
jgi:hypothetical protein